MINFYVKMLFENRFVTETGELNLDNIIQSAEVARVIAVLRSSPQSFDKIMESLLILLSNPDKVVQYHIIYNVRCGRN